jgi:hypothetical protein
MTYEIVAEPMDYGSKWGVAMYLDVDGKRWRKAILLKRKDIDEAEAVELATPLLMAWAMTV